MALRLPQVRIAIDRSSPQHHVAPMYILHQLPSQRHRNAHATPHPTPDIVAFILSIMIWPFAMTGAIAELLITLPCAEAGIYAVRHYRFAVVVSSIAILIVQVGGWVGGCPHVPPVPTLATPCSQPAPSTHDPMLTTRAEHTRVVPTNFGTQCVKYSIPAERGSSSGNPTPHQHNLACHERNTTSHQHI